jgi:DNA-binding PadR family transcriptional regulator
MGKFSLCPCSGKNFEKFLRPAILSLLAKKDSYGYVIAEEIKSLYGYERLDKGGLYKTLRAMEEDDQAESSWDDSGNSPSRRVYKIKKEGLECLKMWRDSLLKYNVQIEKLLEEIKNTEL